MAYAPVNGMNNGRAERLFDDASHERPVYSMGGGNYFETLQAHNNQWGLSGGDSVSP
jgi:hypothetical protein